MDINSTSIKRFGVPFYTKIPLLGQQMTNSRVDTMEDNSALVRSLKEKNEFFKRMVNLIPAKYYLDKETKKAGERFYKNIKEQAPKQHLKEKSTKLTKKKQRLDPNAKQNLQVTELQDALASKEEECERKRKEAGKKTRKGARDDAESSGDEMNTVHVGGDGLQGLGETDGNDWSQPKSIQPVSVERIQSSATISDLRKKVREKIEELRQTRHAKSLEGNVTMSKKMAKQVKESHEKQQRKKETYEAIKTSQDLKRKDKGLKMKNGSKDKDDEIGESEDFEKSKVSFSKFKFEEVEVKKKGKKKKTRRKQSEEKLSGRDFEGLLKKVNVKKQKIAEVKKTNLEAAEDIIKQDKWKAALDRAEGKVVRDDPELLKKSIRKKKEKKKHSEKKWGERETKTRELKAEKQKKRKTNLMGRRDARKAKKVKRLQKKGKLLLKESDYS